MDELIKTVAKQANISVDQAKAAVESVMGFLRDKLPAPIGDQVNNVLSGKAFDVNAVSAALGGLGGQAGDALGNVGKSVGGILGGKK